MPPAPVAESGGISDADASSDVSRLFSPRKSLIPFAAAVANVNARQSFSHNHDPTQNSPRGSTVGQEVPSLQQPMLRRISVEAGSLVASIRAHVSTRPSSLLSSPPETSPSHLLVAAVPSQALSQQQQQQQNLSEHRPRGASMSLRDSYSQDAEMWGEVVSSKPQISTTTSSLANPILANGLNTSNRAPSDAFDLVSPVGEVMERSKVSYMIPIDVQDKSFDRRRQSLAWDYGSAANPQPPRPGEQPLRSPSPETIAIIEATAVREMIMSLFCPTVSWTDMIFSDCGLQPVVQEV